MVDARDEAALAASSILAKLVAFDTTSRNSNLALIDWVEAYLAEHGVAAKRVYDETGQKANLWATIGPAEKPGYILSGHTDVVPVDGQDWTSDPFVLRQAEGRLYGRGAADMKGFLACCLAMVPAMARAGLRRPIHLAFSYDEEVGCVGVRGLIDWLNEQPVRPEACFVGEPTGMGVVIAHKGKRSLEVHVTGRGCHSSLAPEGVNAVDYAAMLAVEIRRIGERLAHGPADPLFDVPVSTAHTGFLHGGTALNIVPDQAELAFEFRVLPGEDAGALAAEVEAIARDVLTPAMQAVAPEAKIDFRPLSSFPALDTPADAEVTRLAKRLAGRNDHAKVAYGTEGGLFQERGGIPSVVVGPGHIAQAHKPDEFIEMAELARCTAFIERLIAHAAGA